MVAVQVNIPMPTAEEREEMNRLDRKLDAFAAMLKERAKAATIEALDRTPL
jgi:hypothetical protein